jgi:hypothetical protein
MSDITERMNYYDGEFLKAVDFQTEQAYHVDRQRRHNQYLHTPGIANGLDVTATTGSSQVTVAPGTAVDDQGRQIILPGPGAATVDLSSLANQTTTALVIIYYSEQLIDNATPNDPTTAMRVQEVANLKAIKPGDIGQYQDCVQLAQIAIDASGKATTDKPDKTVRSHAGAQNITRGWLRLPFFPNPWTEAPPTISNRPQVKGSFNLWASFAACDSNGAVGLMAIPVPPGATTIEYLRLSGNRNDADIDLQLYINGMSGGQFTSTFILQPPTGTIKGVPPKEGSTIALFDESFQLGNSIDPEAQTLSLQVIAYGQSEIWMIAAEFA